MDSACLCLSPPPKILTATLTLAKLRPLDKHTPRIPAQDVGLAVCSLYVQLVNIESFSSRCAIQMMAQPFLYKAEPSILSRTLSEKTDLRTIRSLGFDNSDDGEVASRC